VFSSTFTSPPAYDNLVQVLSIVLWSLTIVVTLKYVFIILRADNEGEGGTFSCYSLLTRYVRETNPPIASPGGTDASRRTSRTETPERRASCA